VLLVRQAQAEVNSVLFPGQAALPGAAPAEPDASNAGAAGSADASPELEGGHVPVPAGGQQPLVQQAPEPAAAAASAEASPELEGGHAPVPAGGQQAPVQLAPEPAAAAASAEASPELEGGHAPVPAGGQQAPVQQPPEAMAAAAPLAVVAQAAAPGICLVSACRMHAGTAVGLPCPGGALDMHARAVPQHAVPRPP